MQFERERKLYDVTLKFPEAVESPERGWVGKPERPKFCNLRSLLPQDSLVAVVSNSPQLGAAVTSAENADWRV